MAMNRPAAAYVRCPAERTGRPDLPAGLAGTQLDALSEEDPTRLAAAVRAEEVPVYRFKSHAELLRVHWALGFLRSV